MADFKHFQPYQSTYVDMKLPEIAEIQRNRYDASKAEYDKLTRALGGIRVAPGDEHIKTDMIQSFDNQLAGNVNWETLMPTVQGLTTQFATNTNLMDAMDTQATHQKEEEFKNKVVMEGGENSLKDFNNQYAKDAAGAIILNPDGTPQMENRYESWNTERDGIYTMGAEAAQDYTKEGLFLLQGINANASILRAAQGIGISQLELNAFFQHGTGISSKRIQDLGKLLTDEFADNNAAGAQMLRDYMQLRVNPTTGNTFTDSEARGEITKFLTDLAMKQQGSKLSYFGNKMYMAAQEAAMNQVQNSNTLFTGTFQADAEKTEALNFEENYKDITRVVGADYMFDPQGNWKFDANQRVKMQAAATAAGRGGDVAGYESERVDELLAATGGNWAQVSAEDLENNMVGIAAWVMDPTNKWNTPAIRKSFVMPDGTPMNDRNFINNMGKILGQGENLRRAKFQPGQRETVASELLTDISNTTIVYTDDNPGKGKTIKQLTDEMSTHPLNPWGYGSQGLLKDFRAAISNTANGNLTAEGAKASGANPVAAVSYNTSGENAGTFNVQFTSSVDGKTMSFNTQPYANFKGGEGFQIAKNSYNIWKTRDLDKVSKMNLQDLGILNSAMAGKKGELVFYNQIIPNAGTDPATGTTWTDMVPAMKITPKDGSAPITYAGWQWQMELEEAGKKAIATNNNFVGQGLRADYYPRTMLTN